VAEFTAFPTGVNVEAAMSAGAPSSQLDKILQGASQWLDNLCGHGPGGFQATASSAFTFDGNGKPLLFIPFAVSISAVSINNALVPSTNWIGYPEESWLPFHRVMLYSPSGSAATGAQSAFPKGTRNVSITAVWGYSATPDELIKEAVILRAADMIRSRSVRTFSPVAGGALADMSFDRDGTKRATEIATQYMRVVPL
jgi:hypothetical protein